MGELKFSGQVLPSVRKIVYNVDFKRVMRSKLVLGIADGWLSADGEIIYRASDLKVGLVQQERGGAAGDVTGFASVRSRSCGRSWPKRAHDIWNAIIKARRA